MYVTPFHMQSFLGEDDAFLNQPPDLPDSQALEFYDKGTLIITEETNSFTLIACTP